MPPLPSTGIALLLIDVINDFDFPAAPDLLRAARPAARALAALKQRLTTAGVPAIYVNDNFGRWQTTFRDQIARCRAETCPGREITELLAPAPEDYFVLKPKHSGFYSTSLEVLLASLGVRTLILGGFAADICVVHTANDAYMRDYQLFVPSDCVASETDAGTAHALDHMRTRLKASTEPSTALRIHHSRG